MRGNARNTLLYGILILALFLSLGPFLWMLLTSLKTYEETLSVPPSLLPQIPQYVNYKIIIDKFPFGKLYINTFTVVAAVLLGQLFISSMAAYSFARLNFPGKKVIFLGALSLMMIPGQIFLIPHYNIMISLKLTNTLRALILPSLFNVFGVFLLRQFFLPISQELDDAAKIDGAGYFLIYHKIMLPLVKSGLLSLAILTTLWTWKALMWPLIVNRSLSKMPLSAGLAFLIGEHTTYYEQVMAGGVIATIPMIIIFILFQRHFIEGITTTGMKV